MSYIGNTNTTQGFVPAVDYFNGNGSTVAFTLSRPVASVAQVQAVIENVPQNPGSAFTVSGNTITFTSAPPSGTSNIYVYYTSPITQVIAPSDGTVGTSALSTGAVTTVKIADTNVTQAKLGTGVAGTGPAFSAYPSGAVSCANFTQTLMAHDTVIYNLGGCYNNTASTATLNGLSVPSYAFCPNVAGYYLVTSTTFLVASTGSIQTQSWKNGSNLVSPSASCPNISNGVGPSVTGLVYLNGAGDYVRSYTYQTSSGTVSTLANRPDLIGFSAALVRAA